MRYLIIALLFLTGCSRCEHKRDIDLQFKGPFHQTQKRAFNGQSAIEASLIQLGSNTIAFFDPNTTGIFARANIADFSTQQTIQPGNARFSYVMEHNGTLYEFVTRNDGVYILTSMDEGFHWIEEGLVLSKSSNPSSNYYQVWNVGVDVDDTGVWHMLIESGIKDATPLDVGLNYSTSTWPLDFDTNRSANFVIKDAGNPFVKFVPNHGILAIYGAMKDVWSTTAATFDGLSWTPHEDKFYIGAPGVHVCDPHAVETPDHGILLTVSVDQDSIYETRAENLTFKDLYESLIQ